MQCTPGRPANFHNVAAEAQVEPSRRRAPVGMTTVFVSSSGCAAPAPLPCRGRNSGRLPAKTPIRFSPEIGDKKLHQKSPAILRAECSLLFSCGSYAVLRQASSDEG